MRWLRARTAGCDNGSTTPTVTIRVVLLALVGLSVVSALSAGGSDPQNKIPIPTTASRVPPSSTSLDLQPSVPGVAVVGDQAPLFSLPNLKPGDGVSLGSPDGLPTLLNFWASWCVPCRKEFPELRRLRSAYPRAELAMVGITFKDTRKDSLRFAVSEGADWQLGFDSTGEVAQGYGVRAVPQTFLINRSGVIIRRWYGRPAIGDLKTAVEALVKAN